MQQNGCDALGTLANCNAANEVAIAEQGGIVAVIGAMGRFEGDAGVQQWGCWALFNLAGNAANKVAIAEQGGIAAVKGAMGRFKDHAEIQQNGAGALQALQ